MSIARTIQAQEEGWWMDAFTHDHTECEFPLPGIPQRPVGTWLYIVYQGVVAVRCQILRIEPRNGPVLVGSDEHPIEARCGLIVQCPGEPAPREIRVRGFMGIRYIPGSGDWDDVEAWANAQQ
jgi:hypothetical protein